MAAESVESANGPTPCTAPKGIPLGSADERNGESLVRVELIKMKLRPKTYSRLLLMVTRTITKKT